MHLSSAMKSAVLIGSLVAGLAQIQAQTPAANATKPAAPAASASDTGFSGKVLETMNAASYTYVLLDTSSGKRWAAAPQTAVKVGDSVVVTDSMAMPNHHSKTLNRDFDVVYFTAGLTVNGVAPGETGAGMGMPANHPNINAAAAKPNMDLSGIKKASGGYTVAEIIAGKTKLKGKEVKVRGRVVKYNANIMSKNWLHIQDGSGAPGSNDLTLTTSSTAKVGDTVLVTGVLATDKDFGAGYKYDLIIENAKVTVE